MYNTQVASNLQKFLTFSCSRSDVNMSSKPTHMHETLINTTTDVVKTCMINVVKKVHLNTINFIHYSLWSILAKKLHALLLLMTCQHYKRQDELINSWSCKFLKSEVELTKLLAFFPMPIDQHDVWVRYEMLVRRILVQSRSISIDLERHFIRSVLELWVMLSFENHHPIFEFPNKNQILFSQRILSYFFEQTHIKTPIIGF